MIEVYQRPYTKRFSLIMAEGVKASNPYSCTYSFLKESYIEASFLFSMSRPHLDSY